MGEVILVCLIVPPLLIAGVIITSKGECYWCGSRLEGVSYSKVKGKNTCDKCWAKGECDND